MNTEVRSRGTLVSFPSTAGAFNTAYDRAVIRAISNSPDLLIREIRSCREAHISHTERWRELFRTNYSFVGATSLARELICQFLAEREQAGLAIPAPGREQVLIRELTHAPQGLPA